jgi:hypothetical protein
MTFGLKTVAWSALSVALACSKPTPLSEPTPVASVATAPIPATTQAPTPAPTTSVPHVNAAALAQLRSALQPGHHIGKSLLSRDVDAPTAKPQEHLTQETEAGRVRIQGARLPPLDLRKSG